MTDHAAPNSQPALTPPDRPRYRLIGQTAAFVGALLVAFSALLVVTARTLLQANIERKEGTYFEYLAVAVRNRIDATLDDYRRQLQTAAAAPRLYVRETGSPVLAACRVAIEQLQNGGSFTWVAFVDAGGKVVASSDQIMEGESVALRPWFLAVRESPYAVRVEKWGELDAALSLPDYGNELPQRVFLAVRIPNERGDLGGVLVAQTGWSWVRQAQQAVLPDYARDIGLGSTVYAGPTDVIADSGVFGWSAAPNAPELSGRRGMYGVKVENTTDGDFLTGYARLAKNADLRWLVTVRQSTAGVFSPVARLTATAIPWAFLLSLFGAALAAWFAYQFTRRLRSVKLAARRIQGGDVVATMPIARDGSEIEEMCDSLAQLIEHLRKEAQSKRSGPPSV
jgi:HAMP domain-containing protein